jgi:acyl transferase domain-containing protein/acyl carrier protein
MAADLGRTNRQWQESGVTPIGPDLGVAALERAVQAGAAQIAVLPVRWGTFLQRFAEGAEPRLLAEFAGVRRRPASDAGRDGRASARAELLQRLDGARPGERTKIISTYVRQQTLDVLGLEPGFALPPHQGLRDLGLDSLLSVELRNRLQRGTGRSLPATLAFDCPTVEAIAEYLDTKALAETRASQPAVAAQPPVAADVAATSDPEAIAVIGLGCRLPAGANDPEAYWQRLLAGYDGTSEVPAERWDLERYFDASADAPGKMYTRRGAFLDRVDLFDPQFFGIAPREAISLDPQQRLLLEVSWEALEHAGQAADNLLGTKTGVFVGINGSDYGFLQMAATTSIPDLYFGTGNAASAAAGRLSYVYGLQGPSISIDTACSSSLVAVHLAVQSLRNRECPLAIAGGVNVMLNPDVTVNFCRARMLSPEGRCKTFDAAADGYVRGEGCGIVVLKRLSDALADGDRILAVIRGSAVNQDGRSSGLTVPNGPAQEEVIREALRVARLEPDDVSYVEAHGTGTSLGDPIELQALGGVLGKDRPADRPLLVGSVKTNIGHLEAAAGIASLIKVVLALQHGEIPRHLHFSTPNPHIAWSDLPVRVVSEGGQWPAGRRIAGVSSFGFTGTNAHIVLEAAPVRGDAAADPGEPGHVLALSAKTEDALRTLAGQYADRIAAKPSELGDLCYTATAGRSHFGHRLAIVGRSSDEIRERLLAVQSGRSTAGAFEGTVDRARTPGVAFLFTGQGSQYAGMGRELYETQPVFRAALDRCAAILADKLERPLLEVIFATSDASLLDETAYTQPALFSIEYALCELWRAWGVVPSAVMGHSVGEFVAACVAGVFSLDDALALVAARAGLMQSLPRGGSMAAVAAAESIVRAAIGDQDGKVAVAAVNAPEQVVISGESGAVDTVVARLADRGARATRLAVSHAFHSPLLEPMLDAFAAVASSIRCEPPRIAVISNVTGAVASGDDLITPQYWRRHAREAVRFATGAATLGSLGERIVLEVGPQPTLTSLARQTLRDGDITWLASMRAGRGDRVTLLETAAALYVRGAAIDWEQVEGGAGRRKVALPTYPFQRQRYWVETSRATERSLAIAPAVFQPANRDALYEVAWPSKPIAADASVTGPGSWLVIGEGDDLTRETARQFEARGSVVIGIEGANDVGHAVEAFLASMPPPRGLVMLLPFAENATADAAARGYRHCERLLEVVNALARRAAEPSVRLWVVTGNAQPVNGNDVRPDQTAVWGLARAIAAEHASLWGGLVDVDRTADVNGAAASIVAAITAGDGEDQVAVRSGERFAARLRPMPVDERSARAPKWRADGAYLITGGFGGLGLEVGRWLARAGVRRLILIGRHALPPREQWDQIDPSSPIGARVSAVLDLEALGATVDAEAIDVGDGGQVAAWLDRYRRARRPPIRGVFHAAGVTQYRAVAEHTSEELQRVWSGKASGAWTLHEQLEDLDCFVLFSSASAILSSPMLGSYAAANAFLDGLADARRSSGRPVLCVNWGNWSRVGMAAGADDRSGTGASEFITPEDGVRILESLMAANVARTAVLPMDWQDWRRRYPMFASAPLLREVIAGAAGEASAGREVPRGSLRPALTAADRAGRLALIEEMLGEAVGGVLRIPRSGIDATQPLRHVGLDSLMALELRNHVQDRAGVTVPLVTFVEGPSIRELAAVIVGTFEAAAASPEAPAGAPIAAPDAETLLEQVDELSDESVDALLRRMLAGPGL